MPDRAAVAQELERIAASDNFRKAERCVRLLRHVIDCAIEGREDALKEYTLGVTVFERPDSFDPRTDPVVRLEVRRLRLKLAEYYHHEGFDDPVIIDVPKGAYVPDFRFRRPPENNAQPQPPEIVARPHRLRIWIAAGLALIAISAAGWYLLRRQTFELAVRPSIAVVGFRNLSPQNENSWIGAAMSELMNINLSAGQRLRATPLENVARMRTELSLSPQANYPVQLLQRIRMNLDSDYVVAGSFSEKDREIHLDVMLFDTRVGRQLADISDDGAEDNLPELMERCAQRVQAQLGVRLPGTGRSPFEANAMELYARGMEKLRQGDALSARTYLEKAEAAAPSNPLVHSGLAAAWTALGLDVRATQEAKLAFDSSTGLGRVEQLEIDGRYRASAQDWPRAIQVYQALFTLSPNDLEYGLLLASAQIRGGKGQEALGTVNALRGFKSPSADDPRIDLAEAQAAGALSDFAHTRRAARSAAEKAQARGARLQYARARLLEAGAMQTLAIDGFAELRTEARHICAELGDRACVAAAERIEANYMTFRDLGAARTLYGEVLEIANQMGNALEKLNALNGLAFAAKRQGDLPAAESYYQAALAVAAEMGPDKTQEVGLNLAEVLAQQGHIAKARALIEQTLQVSQQTGARESIGLGQAVMARTLELEGRGQEALVKYNEALGIMREVNEPYELGELLLEIGNCQTEQGDLAAARKSVEEARTVVGKIWGNSAPEVDMALARLGFAGGDFAGAASHARLAVAGFTTTGREGDRLGAASVLARALLAQGQPAEASKVLAQIPLPDPKKLPSESLLQFQIAHCFILANAGRRQEAERAMDAARADAAHSGVPKLVSEALQATKALREFKYPVQ